jgi:hypothetical protein
MPRTILDEKKVMVGGHQHLLVKRSILTVTLGHMQMSFLFRSMALWLTLRQHALRFCSLKIRTEMAISQPTTLVLKFVTQNVAFTQSSYALT